MALVRYDFLSNRLVSIDPNSVTSLDSTKSLGVFTSLAALIAAHPTASAGNYGDVDVGAGVNVQRYVWDVSDNNYIAQASGLNGVPILSQDNTANLNERISGVWVGDLTEYGLATKDPLGLYVVKNQGFYLGTNKFINPHELVVQTETVSGTADIDLNALTDVLHISGAGNHSLNLPLVSQLFDGKQTTIINNSTGVISFSGGFIHGPNQTGVEITLQPGDVVKFVHYDGDELVTFELNKDNYDKLDVITNVSTISDGRLLIMESGRLVDSGMFVTPTEFNSGNRSIVAGLNSFKLAEAHRLSSRGENVTFTNLADNAEYHPGWQTTDKNGSWVLTQRTPVGDLVQNHSVQSVNTNDLTNPEFNLTSATFDQRLYKFNFEVTIAINDLKIEVFKSGNPFWEDTIPTATVGINSYEGHILDLSKGTTYTIKLSSVNGDVVVKGGTTPFLEIDYRVFDDKSVLISNSLKSNNTYFINKSGSSSNDGLSPTNSFSELSQAEAAINALTTPPSETNKYLIRITDSATYTVDLLTLPEHVSIYGPYANISTSALSSIILSSNTNVLLGDVISTGSIKGIFVMEDIEHSFVKIRDAVVSAGGTVIEMRNTCENTYFSFNRMMLDGNSSTGVGFYQNTGSSGCAADGNLIQINGDGCRGVRSTIASDESANINLKSITEIGTNTDSYGLLCESGTLVANVDSIYVDNAAKFDHNGTLILISQYIIGDLTQNAAGQGYFDVNKHLGGSPTAAYCFGRIGFNFYGVEIHNALSIHNGILLGISGSLMENANDNDDYSTNGATTLKSAASVQRLVGVNRGAGLFIEKDVYDLFADEGTVISTTTVADAPLRSVINNDDQTEKVFEENKTYLITLNLEAESIPVDRQLDVLLVAGTTTIINGTITPTEKNKVFKVVIAPSAGITGLSLNLQTTRISGSGIALITVNNYNVEITRKI